MLRPIRAPPPSGVVVRRRRMRATLSAGQDFVSNEADTTCRRCCRPTHGLGRQSDKPPRRLGATLTSDHQLKGRPARRPNSLGPATYGTATPLARIVYGLVGRPTDGIPDDPGGDST